jgi:hypothetical protein
MGIPRYLEEKIKSIVHCCTSLAIPRTSGDTVKTSETLGGKPVYLGYFSVDLNATSPIVVSGTNIENLVGAEIICKLASGEQYVVNGGALVATICDASVFVDATGDLSIDWSTAHGAGDTLELYLKYTLL